MDKVNSLLLRLKMCFKVFAAASTSQTEQEPHFRDKYPAYCFTHHHYTVNLWMPFKGKRQKSHSLTIQTVAHSLVTNTDGSQNTKDRFTNWPKRSVWALAAIHSNWCSQCAHKLNPFAESCHQQESSAQFHPCIKRILAVHEDGPPESPGQVEFV